MARERECLELYCCCLTFAHKADVLVGHLSFDFDIIVGDDLALGPMIDVAHMDRRDYARACRLHELGIFEGRILPEADATTSTPSITGHSNSVMIKKIIKAQAVYRPVGETGRSITSRAGRKVG